MPASTSEATARLLSSSVASIFSERVTFIVCSPVSCVVQRGYSPHTPFTSGMRRSDFDRTAAIMRQCLIISRDLSTVRARLPTLLEAGADALGRRALRRLADAAGP